MPITTTLHGNDVWLHILLAAPAAYFGFMHKRARDQARHAYKQEPYAPDQCERCSCLSSF
jgi:hypothetical protein